jgi:hypothetical protein
MDRLELSLGEERAIHLPPGDWRVGLGGMRSAVEVRKLWPAEPYPEDDEDEPADRPSPDVVFMVRGVNPGTATLRFTGAGVRDVEVTVRM